ncbi:DUF1746-domain-containing protein [Thozetella sp. PMI_491]|nr:DUF1746-domain-containing protein [Thozetella sp. PMI_491]
MNDEGSAARQPARALGEDDGQDDGREATPPAPASRDAARQPQGQPPSTTTAEATRKQRRKSGQAKKLQFMIHLLKNLDMLFFAEICVLYYMECSLPRLLLRVLPHYLFFTPKADTFLQTLGPQRPQVFAIFAPNILCMLAHLIWPPPRASEATRGYLHGGVIVDFIGQKAPTSKFSLLLLDLVVLGVQCFMLAVHQEAEKLWKIVRPRGGVAASVGADSSTTSATSATAPTAQDQDAEERGVLRDQSREADDTDEIEMRPLMGRGAAGSANSQRRSTQARTSGADLVEVVMSGNAVLADYHVANAIRTAGNDYQSAASYSLQSIGYTATLAALAAERRARMGAQRR